LSAKGKARARFQKCIRLSANLPGHAFHSKKKEPFGSFSLFGEINSDNGETFLAGISSQFQVPRCCI